MVARTLTYGNSEERKKLQPSRLTIFEKKIQMNSAKIKILSIGGNYNFVNEFRTTYPGIDTTYSFIQVDFDSFFTTHIDFNALLFVLNNENIDAIISLYNNLKFTGEPAVILICNSTVKETDISKIPFKNKLVFRTNTTLEELNFNISVIIKKAEMGKKIGEFENRVDKLNSEIDKLKNELNYNRINIEELSQTNSHLIAATWRERDLKKKMTYELDSIKKENDFNKINITELSATNEHLISATWRERDLKKLLKITMEGLENSKNLIEKQNKKISESINYSRKIQNAILPNEELIQHYLPESFILYKPKDVVSGDFPYYYKEANSIYLAAVDCTGHGVPGAMLSLIGFLTLTDIINSPVEKSPAEILTGLHSKIVKTLKQDVPTNDASDGMDIALCKIDLRAKKLQFSGAHRPLFFFRDGQLLEYKAARLPIGGNQYKTKTIFQNHEIDIKKGDSFFIFSDGYQDQFGGPYNKKYSSLSIQNFLIANYNLPMEELKERLTNEFMEWKGEEKQIDDILFIGVKF